MSKFLHVIDGQYVWLDYPRGCVRKELAKWPMECDALGVLPEQVPEAKAALAARGVMADYTPDGTAIVDSYQGYKRWQKAAGVHDRGKKRSGLVSNY